MNEDYELVNCMNLINGVTLITTLLEGWIHLIDLIFFNSFLKTNLMD